MQTLTDQQWQTYETEGWLPLGRLLDDAELRALQDRIDAIMLGDADVDYDRLMMQLETKDGPARHSQSAGFKGSTLGYRKMQNLEFDAPFLTYLQRPLFRHICARAYGEQTAIACFRAMFMNKVAGYGSTLRWHQDHFNFLDRDPTVTIWTALDPATVDNGCVQVVPRSHRTVINPTAVSGSLTDEQIEALLDTADPIALELQPGEGVLLHNLLAHSSSNNTTDQSRRAFSVCYMDARTRSSNSRFEFRRVMGPGALAVGDNGRVVDPEGEPDRKAAS